MSTLDVGDLVNAAASGDETAWNALVDRFAGLVWAVARSYRLDAADAADVSQTTWLRLVEHLGRLREPDRVGAWLAATTRNEALRILRRRGRAAPLLEGEEWADDTHPEPHARLHDLERDEALRVALERLPERCRELLRVLLADPEPSYDEVSAALGLPIGSIGPTRARCLERLRRDPAIARISAPTPGS